MSTTEPTARAMPTQLVSGRSALASALTDSKPNVRRQQEELHRDQPLRTLLGRVREDAPARKAPDMITLAKPSIAESRPKPTSAIEPAAIPAPIATPPSTVIHASDNQESAFTRPASIS